MDPMPLSGIRVVSLAANLPGPLAAAHLRADGATVVKVEPPWGDSLERHAPAWYAELHRDTEVVTLDLKEPGGRGRLDALLEDADLVLVSSRPAARRRLGVDFATLHARHPRLCSVAIVGDRGDPEAPGHDLTYQARAGLVHPSGLPRVLLADMVAGERAATAALTLLLGRERGGEAAEVTVSVQEAAEECAAPVRHGLTTPGGPLGGGSDRYGVYRAREGWIAVAALEDHFWDRLREEAAEVVAAEMEAAEREDAAGDGDAAVERPGTAGTRDPTPPAGDGAGTGSGSAGAPDEPDLVRIFIRRSPDWWEEWARERDLPIVAVPRQW